VIQEMEFEAKNLLTKKEYHRLFNHLNHNNIIPKTQTNYYFETADFELKNHGSALRIRETDDRTVVTLKQPKHDGILETHHVINEQTKEKWLNNQITSLPTINHHLKAIDIDHKQLLYWGKLKTIRLELQKDDHLIVLDKSFYNDLIDYELEVEAKTRALAYQIVNKLLDKYQISKKRTPNKIERFFMTR